MTMFFVTIALLAVAGFAVYTTLQKFEAEKKHNEYMRRRHSSMTSLPWQR